MRIEGSDLRPLEIFNIWWNDHLCRIKAGDVDRPLLEELANRCSHICYTSCDNYYCEVSYLAIVPVPIVTKACPTNGKSRCMMVLFPQHKEPITFYLWGPQVKALVNILDLRLNGDHVCGTCGKFLGQDGYRIGLNGYLCTSCLSDLEEGTSDG